MIIVDDPVEPDSQASRETREAVWKWFKLAPLVRYYGGPAGGSMKD